MFAERAHHALRFCGLAMLAAVAACETDENCPPSGAQQTSCISSRFPIDDPLSREISGRVRRGNEYVPNVLTRMDPSPGLANSDGSPSVKPFNRDGVLPTYVTGDDGLYRWMVAPLRYDLGILAGSDAFSFRAMGIRYIEPSIGPDATPRAFTGRLALTVDPPPAPGHALAFFVTGTDAVTVTGDLASGVVATFRQFTQTLRLHVVDYPVANGLFAPTAYGFSDVRVQANAALPAVVALTTIPPPPFVFTIDATPPSGMTLDPIRIQMDLGIRTSLATVGPTLPGASVVLTKVPGARYAVRVTARSTDGAISDMGYYLFDPAATTTTLPAMALPATFVAPAANDVVSGNAITADAKGPREHILTPTTPGAATIHVVTTDRAPTLPDLVDLGLPRASGSYVWTIRNWPDSNRVDDITGTDIRDVPRTAISAPRTIVIP